MTMYREILLCQKNFGGYEFEGPFTHTGMLDNSSGVYVIVDDNEHSRVIDVGISDEIKRRILGHGRKNQWEKHAKYLACFVLYCAEPLRSNVENTIRNSYNPPSGER